VAIPAFECDERLIQAMPRLCQALGLALVAQSESTASRLCWLGTSTQPDSTPAIAITATRTGGGTEQANTARYRLTYFATPGFDGLYCRTLLASGARAARSPRGTLYHYPACNAPALVAQLSPSVGCVRGAPAAGKGSGWIEICRGPAIGPDGEHWEWISARLLGVLGRRRYGELCRELASQTEAAGGGRVWVPSDRHTPPAGAAPA
jgi:hypothetical protein